MDATEPGVAHAAKGQPRYRGERHGEHELPALGTATRNEASSYRLIFGNARYLRRALLLLVVWFAGYVTVYSYAAGFTSLLAALTYTPPEAGTIAGIGGLGFVASSITASRVSAGLATVFMIADAPRQLAPSAQAACLSMMLEFSVLCSTASIDGRS